MTNRWSRVSVYYPRGHRTGGPEALHQLVDALRSLGQDAVLVPMPGTSHNEPVVEYGHYDTEEAESARDLSDDAVIYPEVMMSAVRQRQATSFMWWLSVDFSPLYGAALALPGPRAGTTERLLLAARRAKSAVYRRAFEGRLGRIEHLAQSHYASEWVTGRLHVEPAIVSDYTTVPLSDRRLQPSARPVIAFNPGRSGDRVDEVRNRLRTDVEWLPLVGLDRLQLRQALERTDVYIELGHLPGKDRLPREAAAAGAISLIAERGAGRFLEDFPLPEDHRIRLTGDFIQNATDSLSHVLADLTHHQSLQTDFRTHVAGEQDQFLREVRSVFVDSPDAAADAQRSGVHP